MTIATRSTESNPRHAGRLCRPWAPWALAALLAGCGGSEPQGDITTASAAAVSPAQAASRATALAATAADDDLSVDDPMLSPNSSGITQTLSLLGVIDTTGPFFQDLGTNGRSCASCHVQAEGWTITPRGLQRRFAQTGGTDPVFRVNDGSNSPRADTSTVHARRAAFSMLLEKGLIRVGIGIPTGAEFELAAVDDPYGYASAAELSLFRRPLPTTNLKFLSTVMWEGRETFKDPNSSNCVVGTSNCFASIHFDLADQSNAATVGHAKAATPLSDEQREAIVSFETSLFTAQVFDRRAGLLSTRGAQGGPKPLSTQQAYFGINDTLFGDYQTRAAFTPNAMTLYDAWSSDSESLQRGSDMNAGRRAVARGQALFNSKPIRIRAVGGLNDDLNVETIAGTCTTCHNTPNAGDHSVPLPLAIGTADAAHRTPDLPLYTLRNKLTGETVQVSDPGRALITGKWKDIGRFKGPVLRALASRAPYFHNGMAADLNAAVDFYDTRFSIGFTAQEKADLVAFLAAL